MSLAGGMLCDCHLQIYIYLRSNKARYTELYNYIYIRSTRYMPYARSNPLFFFIFIFQKLKVSDADSCVL